ncbi:MAG: hypothetical protein ABIY50_07855 [Ignavibacteria bacterium]
MKNLICIIFLTLLFNSCKEYPSGPADHPSENNFSYPFEINSFWYYGTRNFTNNYRPDSLIAYFPTDTLEGVGGAIFLKDTVINNDTLRLLRNSHSVTGHSHATLELYKQTGSGLMRMAFYSDGVNFGPFIPNPNSARFKFGGKEFRSVKDIFNYYKNDLRDYMTGDTTLIFDDPPVVAIKYPIVQNTEWDFNIVGTTKMTKKYTTFESVRLNDVSYNCIKIQKQWYMNGSSTPDPNLIFYDYFSKDGMIKRDFTIKDIAINNSFGQLIGYLDAKEESFLNFYTHP